MVWIYDVTTLASTLPPPCVEADTQMTAVDRRNDRENLFAILSSSDLKALQERLDKIGISEKDLQLIQSGDAKDINWQDHDYEYWALRILKAADTKQITAYAASKMLLFLQALEEYTDGEEVRVFQLVKDDGTIDYDVFCVLSGQNHRNSFYRAVFDWNWYKKLIEAPSNTEPSSILDEHQKLKDQLSQLVDKQGVCATQVFSVALKDDPAFSLALVLPPELLATLLTVRYGDDAVLPAPVIGGLSPAWRFESVTHRDMSIAVPESLGLPFPESIHYDYYPRKTRAYSWHDTEHLITASALTKQERASWIELAIMHRKNTSAYEYFLDLSFGYNYLRSVYDISEDINDALVQCLYSPVRFKINDTIVGIMLKMPGFNLEKFTQEAKKKGTISIQMNHFIQYTITMMKQSITSAGESDYIRV